MIGRGEKDTGLVVWREEMYGLRSFAEAVEGEEEMARAETRLVEIERGTAGGEAKTARAKGSF